MNTTLIGNLKLLLAARYENTPVTLFTWLFGICFAISALLAIYPVIRKFRLNVTAKSHAAFTWFALWTFVLLAIVCFDYGAKHRNERLGDHNWKLLDVTPQFKTYILVPAVVFFTISTILFIVMERRGHEYEIPPFRNKSRFLISPFIVYALTAAITATTA